MRGELLLSLTYFHGDDDHDHGHDDVLFHRYEYDSNDYLNGYHDDFY
jgi:hypothetical protein